MTRALRVLKAAWPYLLVDIGMIVVWISWMIGRS